MDKQPMGETEFDRLWNDLVTGGAPDHPYELPAEDLEALRRFHTIAVNVPSDAARERVDRKVLDAIDRIEKEGTVYSTAMPMLRQPVMNGRAARPDIHLPRRKWSP